MLADRAEVGLPVPLDSREQGGIKRIALAAIPALPHAHALALFAAETLRRISGCPLHRRARQAAHGFRPGWLGASKDIWIRTGVNQICSASANKLRACENSGLVLDAPAVACNSDKGGILGRLAGFHSLRMVGVLALSCAASTAFQPAAVASQGSKPADDVVDDRMIMMQRFVVSATRIERNPWRYASVPGFEVLSRASDHDTHWWLDALQRGQWFENTVMPEDWLPRSPVPYTVIIDDTDLRAVRVGPLHSQPMEFHPPADALTWGPYAEKANVWADHFEAHDDDTFASNTNAYNVDTSNPAYASISLERLIRCRPPLPRWLIAGLLGPDYGIFRESFMLMVDQGSGLSRIDIGQGGLIRKVVGPGTLWVSLDETQRLLKELKKNKKLVLAVPPLRDLFAEAPPIDASLPLSKCEAALFVRWGLMGPGNADPVLSHGFLELVRRARREPVTEQVFIDCFGFGYARMEEKLGSFLNAVLAQPNAVALDVPLNFPEPDLKNATADQIGRILGDWLRMEGNSVRAKDPTRGDEFHRAAGRMLERAYREDNGLPPDVNPAPMGARSAEPAQTAALGQAVAMKPFVVAADRIHDPSLLAVYGLYEHDIGDDDKAREFLEAAAVAGAIRPKACLVLATLRYAEAIAKPAGSKGKLSAHQATAVLEPLRTALRHSAVPDIYTLMVKTWNHCEAKPSDQELETIIEGVSLFPRFTALSYGSAVVCAHRGVTARAIELIDKALVFAMNESDRDHLKRLRVVVASGITEADYVPR
jgi:hypothetical protein